MRLILLFIVAGLLHVSAATNAQTITLKGNRLSFDKVLQAIRQQTGYTVFTAEAVVKNTKSISVDAKNMPVDQFLETIFTGLPLEATIDNKTIVIKRKSTVVPATRRDRTPAIESVQQRVISGQVTDAEGAPLAGVTVRVTGTNAATTTNTSGRYELQIPEGGTAVTFTNIGYVSVEQLIGTQSVLDAVLQTSISDLDEVVVVGYGTQRRSDVTGAVKQIDGSELSSQASVNTSAALVGKIAGVQAYQHSGQPGANDATIRIRGVGTLGNSAPLILIDGVPGNLDNVPSIDIENVTILKDAASASVYGSRAANGVILVTTKRGKDSKPSINFQSFLGVHSPTNHPEFVDGETFMRLQNLGSTNVGASPIWSEDYISEWKEHHTTDPDNYPSTDWVKEAFSEPGLQQRYALSVSGGNEVFNFLSSLSYDDEQANIPNYNFKRYAFRLNSDVQLTKKLSFDFDVSISRRDQVNPAQGIDRIIVDVYRIPSVYVSRFSHGGWGPAFNLHNPIAYIHDGGQNRGIATNSRIKMASTFKPVEGFDISIIYTPVQRISEGKNMRKSYDIYDADGSIAQKMPEINRLGQSYGSVFTHNFNAIANYKKAIDLHRFSAMAGYEFISSKTKGFSASRTEYQFQEYEELDAGSIANQLNSGSATDWALQSVFGRINYAFDKKYLVEGNLRYDGSSRFIPENRWSLFPSFSVGWILSEELFLTNSSIIDYLKIRGSWGVLGNQEIGNYPFLTTVDFGEDYIFGGTARPGAAQTSFANEHISWERTESSNIGFDLTFLNNKLNITYDYFVRNTSGILLRLPIPAILGQTAPYQNAGEVRNSGSELEVGFQQATPSGLQYSASFNISHVKNRIINLRETGPYISGARIDKEGYPIQSLYGYRALGLFQNEAEIESHATQIGQIAPGDIKYADLNNDGMINADDREIIGDHFPALNFGLNISIRYKGFDLMAFAQGVERDVYLKDYAAWPLFNGSNVRKWQAESYWTPERPNATMPRFTAGSSHNNFQASDFWVYDASYIRLRSLQVGYTIPNKLLGKSRLNAIRVFFLGENLFTFSKMPQGVDPNVPIGDTYFPITKLFSFGVNVSL